MALVLDPITGALVDEKTLANKNKQKKKKEQNKQDLVKADKDETDIK